MWNGMEWNGMEWNGMEWNGMRQRDNVATLTVRRAVHHAVEASRYLVLPSYHVYTSATADTDATIIRCSHAACGCQHPSSITLSHTTHACFRVS